MAQCQYCHDPSTPDRKGLMPAKACPESKAYFTAHTSSTSKVTLLSLKQPKRSAAKTSALQLHPGAGTGGMRRTVELHHSLLLAAQVVPDGVQHLVQPHVRPCAVHVAWDRKESSFSAQAKLCSEGQVGSAQKMCTSSQASFSLAGPLGTR